MNNEESQELVDTHTEDCLTFFGQVLTESFSGISLARFSSTSWRAGWRITVHPHLLDHEDEVTTKDIEEGVKTLRDMIFWDKDVLIDYEIREVDEDE